MRVFFAIFLLAGVAMFFSMLVIPGINICRAQFWEEVPCRIVSSEVVTHADSDGDTYSVKIGYSYRYQSTTYQSDRFDFFGQTSSSGRKAKEAVVRSFPPGKEATCFVNPSKPSAAVLDRRLKGSLWLGLVSIPFVGIGLLTFMPGRLFTKGNAAAGPVTATWRQRKTGLPAVTSSEPIGGMVELRPQLAPKTKVIRSVVFAVAWVGVVILLGVMANNAYQSGHPQHVLTAFFLIFGFVALLLIGDSVQAVMALFRPEILITVNRTAIPLGETLELQWLLRGRAAQFERLQLRIEAHEEAEYRRGTDLLTDRQTFFEKQLADEDQPETICRGQTQAVIPPHLMHTFEARHNKIVWTVRLKGHRPSASPLEEIFPLIVLPQSGAPPQAQEETL